MARENGCGLWSFLKFLVGSAVVMMLLLLTFGMIDLRSRND